MQEEEEEKDLEIEKSKLNENPNNEEAKQELDYTEVDYKGKYRNLKRKLKSLLYEQECFHEELRKIQRKCLRVSRDKSFLLDRLLQYEQPDVSSDEELTESSSEEDNDTVISNNKKKDSSKIKFPDAKKSKVSSNTKTANQNSSGEKLRCKQVENGKQCTKLVNKRIKSGICQTHRQAANKQEKETTEVKESSPTKPSQTPLPRKPPTGGKDIGQIREAMEASSRIAESSPENEDEEDDLVIDLPH